MAGNIGRKTSHRHKTKALLRFANQLVEVLAVVGVIVLSASIWVTTAAATVPPAPIGMDVNGTEFAILSNVHFNWQVKSNEGPFGHAKMASLGLNPVPGASDAFHRQQYAYIWASTCTTARQTVTFRRTYFLMGRPKTLAVELYDTTHLPAPANKAISSAKIYINGKVAFSVAGAYLSLPEMDRPQQAKLFKYGDNIIDVVVVKRAESGDLGRCKSTPTTPLGILLNMRGKYEAELWVTSKSPEEFWRRVPVDENLHSPFVVGGSPQNHGPSGIYKGKLVVDFSGGGAVTDKIATITGTGLRNCVVTQTAQVHMECEIYRMPPGATPRATFKALAKWEFKFDVVSTYSHTEVYASTADPNFSTNRWIRYHYFCGKSATNPKCPP